MMFRKSVWIPILSAGLFVVGCGLFYGRQVANQEPIKIYKPVEVEKQAKPKPPPPGETHETGHWHGDEWHANDAHAPVEVSEAETSEPATPAAPTEVQGGSGNINAVKAQVTPLGKPESSIRTRTPQEMAEIQRQWREWQAWTKKAQELRVKFSEVSKLNTALMPETAEEAERYKTDKEWQRKVQEATDKYDEVLEMMQEHEANRILPPSQSFR